MRRSRGSASAEPGGRATPGACRTACGRRIARLLFAPSGLHLSQYRYNIGGGGAIATAARFAPGYLRRSGAYDWAADPAGRDMLRRAAALGVGHLVAFANAAPPAFTTNGRGCGGSLRSDRVAQYAAYLARVVSHLSANGTPIALVSPMNEPDSSFSSCNQEGMTVPVSLRARLIQAVQAALARRGSAAGVLADESGGAGALLHEAPGWLAGAGGSAQPAALAYHAYDDPDAGRLDAVRTLAGAAARPAYMSEVCCMVDGHFRRGFHPQMRGALWVARAIWRNLALGGASSFSWWVALSPELGCDARQASCGRVANRSGWDDGLIYYDRDYRADGSTRLVLTKRYWAYAQFSRWVRPGMRPHEVTGDTGGAQGAGVHRARPHRGARRRAAQTAGAVLAAAAVDRVGDRSGLADVHGSQRRAASGRWTCTRACSGRSCPRAASRPTCCRG